MVLFMYVFLSFFFSIIIIIVLYFLIPFIIIIEVGKRILQQNSVRNVHATHSILIQEWNYWLSSITILLMVRKAECNLGKLGNQMKKRPKSTIFQILSIVPDLLLLNGHVQDFTFAGKIKGESKPAACMFYLPPPPGARYFDTQVAAIEKMLESGQPTYPVERTLLTTGVIEAMMESHSSRSIPRSSNTHTRPATKAAAIGLGRPWK